MAKTTTNKSFREDNPIKALRRAALNDGEADERRLTAGASGDRSHRRKRPGRAAALLTTTHRTRSQRWRSLAKGKGKGPARRPRA